MYSDVSDEEVGLQEAGTGEEGLKDKSEAKMKARKW